MFSEHKGIKLRAINRRISGKYPNDTFLNIPQIKKSQEKLNICLTKCVRSRA